MPLTSKVAAWGSVPEWIQCLCFMTVNALDLIFSGPRKERTRLFRWGWTLLPASWSFPLLCSGKINTTGTISVCIWKKGLHSQQKNYKWILRRKVWPEWIGGGRKPLCLDKALFREGLQAPIWTSFLWEIPAPPAPTSLSSYLGKFWFLLAYLI